MEWLFWLFMIVFVIPGIGGSVYRWYRRSKDPKYESRYERNKRLKKHNDDDDEDDDEPGYDTKVTTPGYDEYYYYGDGSRD
jgi:hypothetical protein